MQQRLNLILAFALVLSVIVTAWSGSRASAPHAFAGVRAPIEGQEARTWRGEAQAAVAAAGTPVLPSGFVYENVLTGLTQATSIGFAQGTRMFVGQKGGLVRVADLQNNTWTLRTTPFIDLTAETNAALDRGLLALAVHPAFPQQPYVYILYSFNPPGLPSTATNDGSRVMRLLRVTADAAQGYAVASTAAGSRVTILGTNSTLANVGDPATPDSRTNYACQGAPTNPYVQDCLPADSNNHAGADMRFASDGSLYVATGDATPPNGNPRAIRAQDLDSLSGKLLRIDPLTGDGYATNPFYDGNLKSNRSKVVSYGLRNPFRITLHPTTQEVYIGDVGWDTWEELNAGRGKNFGWPCYEGGSAGNVRQNAYAGQAKCTALYNQGAGAVQAPLYAYAHNGAGASIIGGDFYSGTAYPAQYRGALFFYDFNLTWIKTAQISGNTATIADFAQNAGNNNDYGNGIVQIIAGPDTNLYTVNLSTIRRIRYTAGNVPPIAQASATPIAGRLPLTVSFSSAGSSDPEGQSLSYRWAFGDGGSSTLANPSYTYTTAGVFKATLTITDASGATASAEVTIYAGNTAPSVVINTPAVGTTFAANDQISYSGSATDADDGDLSAALRWEVLLHHNDHTHFGFHTSTGPSGSFIAADHGEGNWWLEICATATDRQGLATRACRNLPARTVQYTFDTVPSGLSLTYGGISRVTPFTIAAIVNASQQVVAPLTQGTYEYLSWSDGGASTHTITIQPSNQTLVATYRNTFSVPMNERRSFQAVNGTTHYIHNRAGIGHLDPISATSTATDKQDATFVLVSGLDTSKPGCVSFQSIANTSVYMRHYGYRLNFQANDGSAVFRSDATFCPKPGLAGSGASFESANYAGYHIRHKNYELWIEPADGSAIYPQDASFNIVAPWLPSGGTPTATATRTSTTGVATATRTRTSTTPPTSCPSGGGSILREYWAGVTGISVANIPVGTTPSGTSTLTSFEGPTNWADNYGTRVRGLLCAPTSGSYTFWIASDDASELWLSTDATSANRRRIAYVSGWTNSREWGKEANQRSVAITLTGGQRYYIEALQKEGTGGDNLAVAWQGPGLTQQVIPGQYLYPPGTPPTSTATRTFTSVPATATRTFTGVPATATRTRTPTSGSGGTCSPATTIAAPFTFDGSGTFCWQIATIPSYINSWNLTSLTVNGVNVTNLYVAADQLPPKINGSWYISYNSNVTWGHIEIR